jgi:hypothetical protein
MLDNVPGRTRLWSGTITVLPRSGCRSLQWELRVWTSTKPARSSARVSRAPETSVEAPGHAEVRTLIGRTIGGAGAGSSSK